MTSRRTFRKIQPDTSANLLAMHEVTMAHLNACQAQRRPPTSLRVWLGCAVTGLVFVGMPIARVFS